MRRSYVVLMFVLGFMFSACYEHGSSEITYGSLSFQYDEPKEYCSKSIKADGFELDCAEGRISVEIIEETENKSMAETFAEILDNPSMKHFDFVVEDAESQQSETTFAWANDPLTDRRDVPSAIAISKFGDRHYVITKAFLQSEEDKERFFADFEVVAMSVRPVDKN